MSTVGVTTFPRFCHALHSRHVSTIDLIIVSLVSSTPAVINIWRIFGSLACHHRRCSLLSSSITICGLNDLILLMLSRMSKLVQSGKRVVPEPVSVHVLRVRGSVSGPRPSRSSSVVASAGTTARRPANRHLLISYVRPGSDSLGFL